MIDSYAPEGLNFFLYCWHEILPLPVSPVIKSETHDLIFKALQCVKNSFYDLVRKKSFHSLVRKKSFYALVLENRPNSQVLKKEVQKSFVQLS